MTKGKLIKTVDRADNFQIFLSCISHGIVYTYMYIQYHTIMAHKIYTIYIQNYQKHMYNIILRQQNVKKNYIACCIVDFLFSDIYTI